MCKHKDILNPPISKTATMLPTSMALRFEEADKIGTSNDSRHYTACFQMGFSWYDRVKRLHALDHIRTVEKDSQKHMRVVFRRNTHEIYTQTRKHGDGI